MSVLDEVRNLYAKYLEEALSAEKKQKLTDGMFGFGKKAADDPCHSAFYEALKALLEAYAGETPDSGCVSEILSFIYQEPLHHREPPSIYWMLIAAHGLTSSLTETLSAKDAAALYEAYSKNYSRWELLPVQKDIYRRLKKIAKQKEENK